MTTETANSAHHLINKLRKHLGVGIKQASRTGKPTLGKNWQAHAEITDPEHHYRHMDAHQNLAEKHGAQAIHHIDQGRLHERAGRSNVAAHHFAKAEHHHAKAELHDSWAKGHHAFARNKLKHMEHRPDVQHSSVDPDLVSKVMDHPLVKEHPHSVFHQHDGSKHHVEFGGGDYEKAGHASHEDLHQAITHACADYHQKNKKWSAAASIGSPTNSEADKVVKQASDQANKAIVSPLHPIQNTKELLSKVETASGHPAEHHEAVNHLHSLGATTKEHTDMGLPTHTANLPKEQRQALHNKLTGSGFEHKAEPFGPSHPVKHLYTKGDTKVAISTPHYTDHETNSLTHHRVMVQSNFGKK
jgi:hypothetical protein